MKYLITSICCIIGLFVVAQVNSPVFIKLVEPFKAENIVHFPRQYIVGSTCTNCTLTINEKPVYVYGTGGFAFEANLVEGVNAFDLQSRSKDKSLSKKISFTYAPVKPAEPAKSIQETNIEIYPEGNLVLKPGDKVNLKVKTLPHSTVKAFNKINLYEMPVTGINRMPGIYQAEYVVQAGDDFNQLKIPFTIIDSSGQSLVKISDKTITILSPSAPDILRTKGRLAHLEFGLGDDRLGGAKIGYLDSSILLKMIGKVGTHYKVQLSKYHTAYIPDEHVELMPKGTFTPESLTGKWQVYGEEKFDVVKVGLSEKLSYQSFQLINPSQIVVDVFGATNNTNWITQMENVKEISNVHYEQIEDDVFRIFIDLKHQQHWGHQIYYSGNNLVIKIRHQPEHLSLSNLTIAIDAGHGGSNNGAVGPTGIYEKELTLQLSKRLKAALEKAGAKVIMTREEERFFDNKERILFYRDSLPDLLLSLHLNSAEDPIRIGGTSTYYRYVGFRKLSEDIYKRMLELGLKEYGNTGSFNFMLNSPTEYPNALIETLFLSNPEEEEKILDKDFQQKMIDKIVLGLNDFLSGCK